MNFLHLLRDNNSNYETEIVIVTQREQFKFEK